MLGGLRICTVTGSTLIGASPVAMFSLTANRGLVAPGDLYAANEFWT